MDEKQTLDTGTKRPPWVRLFHFFRVLTLLLYGVGFLLVLYLLIGTDVHWNRLFPVVPEAAVEIVAGFFVLCWFSVSAVALLSDGWRLWITTLAAVHVLLAVSTTLVYIASPGGWLFPVWVGWLFGVIMPLMAAGLMFAVAILPIDPANRNRYPRMYPSNLLLKLSIAVGAIAGILSLGYWYYERPTCVFQNLNGTILELGPNGGYAYSLKNGADSVIQFGEPRHSSHYAGPMCDLFCQGRGDTLFIGDVSGYPGLNYHHLSLCAFVPFENSILLSKSMTLDSGMFSSVDYLSATNQMLLTGTLRGNVGLFLVDLQFNLLAEFTNASGILGTDGWPAARAYFLDSARFLLASRHSCDIFDVRDSSRTPIAQGEFRALSPDRKHLIVSRKDDLSDRHFRVAVSDGAEEELDIPPPHVGTFVFSPDGRSLLYSLYQKDLFYSSTRCYIYDMNSRRSVKTPLAHADAWIPKELPSQ